MENGSFAVRKERACVSFAVKADLILSSGGGKKHLSAPTFYKGRKALL